MGVKPGSTVALALPNNAENVGGLYHIKGNKLLMLSFLSWVLIFMQLIIVVRQVVAHYAAAKAGFVVAGAE